MEIGGVLGNAGPPGSGIQNEDGRESEATQRLQPTVPGVPAVHPGFGLDLCPGESKPHQTQRTAGQAMQQRLVVQGFRGQIHPQGRHPLRLRVRLGVEAPRQQKREEEDPQRNPTDVAEHAFTCVPGHVRDTLPCFDAGPPGH